MKRLNYSKRAFIMIFSVCVICIFISVIIMWHNTNKIYLNKYIEQDETILTHISRQLDEKIAGLLEQISYVEISPEFAAAKKISQKDDDSNFVRLCEVFQKQSQLNTMIDTIYYYRPDGRMFYDYSRKILKGDINISNEPWYKKTQKVYPYVLWYKAHSQSVFKGETSEVLSVSRVVENSTREKYGVLVFYLRASYFKELIGDILKNSGDSCFLVNSTSNTMFAIGDGAKKLPKKYKGEIGTVINGNDVISYSTLNTIDWKIVYLTNKNNIAQASNMMVGGVIIALLVGIMLAFFMLLFNVNWFTKPIRELSAVMGKVRGGKLSARWNCKSNNMEITEMADDFNSMADSISELIGKVAAGHKLNNELNIKVLEEQLNSHFLYNVLNSIYYMAETGDHEKTAAMTAALGEFVRHSMNKGQSMTTLEKELEHVKNYIYIESFRYGDKFSFETDIQEETLGIIVPKIILQPLVENAIIHGLFEFESGGLIRLCARSDEKYLYISVYDNGCGIDKNQLEKINSGEYDPEENGMKGFALQNLRKRLELNYSDYEFTAESKLGEFTVIKIRIEKKFNTKEGGILGDLCGET